MSAANPQHRTVPMATPWGETVDIDEAIWPLISRLWGLGVRTTQSCQGRRNIASDPRDQGPARVWIRFRHANHAHTFVRAACLYAERARAGFRYELGFGPGGGSAETDVYFSPAYLTIAMRALGSGDDL